MTMTEKSKLAEIQAKQIQAQDAKITATIFELEDVKFMIAKLTEQRNKLERRLYRQKLALRKIRKMEVPEVDDVEILIDNMTA